MWISYGHWGMHKIHIFEPVPAKAYICWDGFF